MMEADGPCAAGCSANNAADALRPCYGRSGGPNAGDGDGVCQMENFPLQAPSTRRMCIRGCSAAKRERASRDNMKAALPKASDSVALGATTLTWHNPSTGSPVPRAWPFPTSRPMRR